MVLALPVLLFLGSLTDWVAVTVYGGLVLLGRFLDRYREGLGIGVHFLGLYPLASWYAFAPEGLPQRLEFGTAGYLLLIMAPTLALSAGWGVRGAVLAWVLGQALVLDEWSAWLTRAYLLGVTGIIGVFLHRFRRELWGAALTDPLTGLGNRRALEVDYPRFQALARRLRQPLLLTVWDLDDLKRINDTLGHAAGDEHILRFVRALKPVTREQDGVYRIGGDEFCGLHLGLASGAAIQARVQQRFPQVSVGWACADDAPLDAALAEADQHMYRAKAVKLRISPQRLTRES